MARGEKSEKFQNKSRKVEKAKLIQAGRQPREVEKGGASRSPRPASCAAFGGRIFSSDRGDGAPGVKGGRFGGGPGEECGEV